MSTTEHVPRNGDSSRRPTRWDRARDGLTFLGAWVIIGWQMFMVPPRDVNESFLILAAGLLGVPYGTEAVARLRGGAGAGTTSSGSP